MMFLQGARNLKLRHCSGSCHVPPVPAPLFDVVENRSLRIPQPIAEFGCESEVQMTENEDSCDEQRFSKFRYRKLLI